VDSLKRVEELCKAGARWITLKTGAYRPVDLSLPARAVTLASAGQAWSAHCRRSWRRHRPEPGAQDERGGIPLRRYLDKLAAQGEYIPAIALGGRVHLQRSDLQGLRALRVLCQADGRVKLMAGHAVRWLRRGLPRTWAKRSGLRSAHLGRAFRNDGGWDLCDLDRVAGKVRRSPQQASARRDQLLHLLPARGAGPAAVDGRSAEGFRLNTLTERISRRWRQRRTASGISNWSTMLPGTKPKQSWLS